MTVLRVLASRFLAVFRNRRLEARLEEELRGHLEMLEEDYRRQGMTLEEARHAARKDLGGVDQVKEAYRDARGLPLLEIALHDLHYAGRALRGSPGFTTAAVLSLALGIGANTAVFSVVNALMLRELPVRSPQELVTIGAEHKGDWDMISFPMYRDLRERQRVFIDMLASAGETPLRITIPSTGGPPAELENMRVSFVTANYFDVLGVRPVIGRLLRADDDSNPSVSETVGSVVVLSYGLWESQFGSDPRVLDRTILIRRSPCRIVGVAPRGFFGEVVGSSPAAWVPLVPFTSPGNLDNRRGTFTSYMARLKPGVSRVQAQAGLSLLFQQLLLDEGRIPDEAGSHVIDLRAGATGLDYELRRTFRKPLWIVMAVVALVLLIACANVANLLLARGARRRGETSLRLAIGCSRRRLVAQWLTESLLLSFLGAVAGAVIAYAGSRALVRLVDFGAATRLDLSADVRVFAFLAALALLSGLGFGIVPALRASNVDVVPVLKATPRGARGSRQRLSRVLVAGQVALSLLLLVAAGLLIGSVRNLHRRDRGFRSQHVVLFDLAHSPERREPAALAHVADQVCERIRQVPGVESASVSALLLFGPSDLSLSLAIQGYTPAPDEKVMARFNSVSPGYLETVGMTLVAGRGIEDLDGFDAPRVAVVNEAMARRYFPGGGAVGRTFEVTAGSNQGKPVSVVGVVRDAKYNDLRAETKPMLYVPFAQLPRSLRSLEVRTSLPLSTIAGPVRRALGEISKDLMIRRVVSLNDQVDQSLAAERLIMKLCSVFGGLALLLACVGLYGVMAYAVAQRTGEIGIRMALGARPAAVQWLVLRETVGVVAGGVVVGLVLAQAAARLVSSFLYGLTAGDPGTLALAILLLLSAAALAAYLPARRAARVDPMVALRQE